MLIVYRGPSQARSIRSIGFIRRVVKDDPTELPDDVALRLIEDDPGSWEKASESTTAPAEDAGGGE